MGDLDAITALLYGPGISMVGHEMTNDQAISKVRERFPTRHYCLVRDWIWIDLDMPSEVREHLIDTGRQPIMLYAHNVVFDSLKRFDSGDWVRSTPLVNLSEGVFFETKNSVYVLIGHGIRKRAALSTVIEVF